MPVVEVYERITIRSEAVPVLDGFPVCTPADPFEIDHDCRSPRGHSFVGSCSDVVCVHCGRIAWQ